MIGDKIGNRGGLIMKHLLRLLLPLVSEKALLMISNFPQLLYSSMILQCQLLVVLDQYMKSCR